MTRSVTVNADNVDINGVVYKTGNTVTISDATFSTLTTAGRFSGGSPVLTDNGSVADDGDNVFTQAANVAAVGALTSAASVAAPTKIEFDKVVADLATLRTAHNALLTAITGTGKPMHT